MTEKEMRRLSRAELLELLLVQTKETERIQKRLERAEAELADRQLQIQKAGNLAQAALEINHVMEAAQAAAQQYLDNIIRMEAETKQRCEAMLAQAGLKTEQIPQSENLMADIPETALIKEIYELID